MLGCVDGRLAHGQQQRVDGGRDLDIADHDEVDRHLVIELDLGGDALSPRAERADDGAGLHVVQPAAQLSFLTTGQHDHPPWVGRGSLHQRQRLQHRIVQMCRHVVALLITNAGPLLVAQLGRQPPDIRTDQHRCTGHRHRQSGQRCRQLLHAHAAGNQCNDPGERKSHAAQRT